MVINLSGITVTLDDGAGNVLTTTTDSDGNYLFEDVTPGNYIIEQINNPNSVDVTDVEGAPDDSQIAITVDIGETVVAQNFVDEKVGSIAGIVTTDLTNNGTGDTGLAGVVLTLTDNSGTPLTNINGDNITATTNNQGEYIFTDVPPGDYRVVETQPTDYSDVSETDGDNPNDGRVNSIDVSLSPEEASTGNNFVEIQLGEVTGRITADVDNNDTGDTGLAGVVVTLTDSNGNSTTTTTNNQGEYTFSDVVPGNYTVVETQPTDYANVSEVDGGDDGDNLDSSILNSIPVIVSPGEIDSGNDFVEEQFGSVSGNVSANTESGIENLNGVTIQLRDGSDNLVQTTTTGTDGNYSFSDVVPGNYTVVELQPEAYSNVSEVDGLNDGGDDSDNGDNGVVNSIPVIVNAGLEDSGNNFVEIENGSITGNVSQDNDNDGDGEENLSGITITLEDSAGNVLTTTTDGDGNYLFEDVTPGDYTITQTNDTDFVDVTDVEGAPNDSQVAVTVGIGETVVAQNFVDEVPASIAGNVSQDNDNDDAGDTNLSGITITLDDGAGNILTTTTDVDGNYLFEDLTPGDYTITQENDTDFVDVTDVEGAPNDSQVAVTVGIGETVVAQNFVDEVPASIAGNVSQDNDNDDAGDTNLSGITITLDDGAGNILTTTTDVDGNYLFEDLTPGDYTITQENDTDFVDVTDVEGAPNDSQVAVTVGIGETVVAQNFVDEVPASIAGNVSRDDNNDDAGDINLAGITVTLDDGAGNVLTTTTDSDGNYLFEDVTPGNYIIEQINNPNSVDVTDVEGAPDDSQIAITVDIGETVVAQNFVDEKVGSIAGIVTTDLTNNGTGDTGLAGVVLTLTDNSGTPLTNINGDNITATTNNQGEYIFTDVPPGDYRVVETQPTDYSDVSETDGDNPNDGRVNSIDVSLSPEEASTGNNFVEIQLGEVTGRITADVDNNDTGDTGLAGVVVTLTDSNGNSTTTTTNNQGEYTFSDVVPGNYTVVETQPTDYANVSEVDGGDDGDNLDSSILNSIPVIVSPGEIDSGNDFVEEQFGSVSGNVSANTESGIENLNGVTIQLRDGSDNLVQTTTTGTDGNYSFSDVVPGNYTVVELQPEAYSNVSEVDGLNDGGDDSDNGDNGVVNSIPVIVNAGLEDSGNNFVEIENGSITGNVSQG